MSVKMTEKLESIFNAKLIDEVALSEDVTLLSFTNRKIILKEVNQKVLDIYHYLASENVVGVRLPIKKISDGKKVYLAFAYLKPVKYHQEKQVLDLISTMNDLHHKTAFDIKLEPKYFKFFFRVYKGLDRIFQTLEMWIRESEQNPQKDDFDWIVLSKYHLFLDTKKIMYELQKKIHKYLDNKGNVIFALNHGNPSLEHFIDHQLISFNNSYLGIFVSDYAKLYVSLDHLSEDYFKEIERVLESYQNNFYLLYFKFLVLYIYMISLNFDSFNRKYSVEIYLQIATRIKKFLKLTAKYH